MSSSGLMAWQTISMSWLYWSYASASCFEWRAISFWFWAWSWVNRR